MRRRVLAGVQAGPAVVAQVGQKVDVGLAEFQAPRHRWEDGAKRLAVAAGIADLHLAGHLALGRTQGQAHRPIGQIAGLAGQRSECFHDLLLIL